MTPFASVEDYLARYPDSDAEIEHGVLLACLEDATAVISAELDGCDIDYQDPTESFTVRLRSVCRDMAHRALASGGGSAGDIPFGATQMSQTNDFATASYQLANPYGDLFMTSSERMRLGIGRQQAVVLNPYA